MAIKNYYSADENAKPIKILRLVLGIALIIAVVVTTFFVYSKVAKETKSDANVSAEKQTTTAKSDIDSVLFVVEDDSYSSINPLFVLASCNNTKGEISVLQIPANYKIDSGDYKGTIKSMFSNGGGKQAMIAINAQMGINIDNYVVCSKSEVSKIVDKLGGLELNIQDRMTFSLPDGKNVILVSGSQNLNGSQVVQYLRYNKWGNADANAKKQADILVKLVNQYVNELDCDSLLSFYEDYSNEISTDFSIVTARSFCENIKSYQNKGDTVAKCLDVKVGSKFSQKDLKVIRSYLE